MQKDKYKLGIIELNDKVYVSDPCYNVGTWCQALVENVKPGKYYGFMYKTNDTDGWGRRVTDLWIVHEDNINDYPELLINDVNIGVDSGAAGIYDKEYFEKYHTFEKGKYVDDYPESSDWYDKQFDLRYDFDINGNPIKEKIHPEKGYFYTEQERREGIALDNKCVISFSGYGDGGYDLFECKNSDDQIVGLRINFINENNEDE